MINLKNLQIDHTFKLGNFKMHRCQAGWGILGTEIHTVAMFEKQ